MGAKIQAFDIFQTSLSSQGLKKRVTQGNLVDSPTHRCRESIFEYEYISEFMSKSERFERLCIVTIV
jgi:hypothetical protein